MAQVLRLEKLRIINKIGDSNIPLLDNIDAIIEEKEWLTFLIPHGGGKTSLYKVLLSQVKPTSGKVIYTNSSKMDEYDTEKFLRENVTAVPEYPTFQETFSVKDWINLQIELIRPPKYKTRLKQYYDFLKSQNINIEKNLYNLKLVEMRKLELSFSILADTILIICDDIDVGLKKDELEELEAYLKVLNKNRAVIMISGNPIWNKYSKKVIRL